MIWIFLIVAVYIFIDVCIRQRPKKVDIYKQHLIADREQAEDISRKREAIWERSKEKREKYEKEIKTQQKIGRNLFKAFELIGWFRDEHNRRWITPCGVLEDVEIYFSTKLYVHTAIYLLKKKNLFAAVAQW